MQNITVVLNDSHFYTGQIYSRDLTLARASFTLTPGLFYFYLDIYLIQYQLTRVLTVVCV